MEAMTPPEVAMLINNYIGVRDGYLQDFSSNGLVMFFAEYCGLKINPRDYEGTTRNRFRVILTQSDPPTQARILEGILEKCPPGSSELRTDEKAHRLRTIAARLKGLAPDRPLASQADVLHAACRLIESNGKTTMLEVKEELRDKGLLATQQLVSEQMDSLALGNVLQRTPGPGYRHYVLPNVTTAPSTGQIDSTVDVVILTVLPEEYDAVCSKLSGLRNAPLIATHPNIYAWKLGKLPSANSAYTIAVGMMGRAGTNNSALFVIDASTRWSPRYIFFVGVAGGIGSSISKGDVLIADIIHGYEYGKIETSGEFTPRADWTFRTDLGLLNCAVAHANSGWRALVQTRPPESAPMRCKQGEVASGDKVVDNPTATFFDAVMTAWPKITAVEMEGAGAARGLEHLQTLGKQGHFLMIRGISDLPRNEAVGQADMGARGTRERDDWKPFASDAAASFATSLISAGLPLPPQ
jgi:nucleoside phosphorylase